MADDSLPTRVVNRMYENDFFSQWLGIQRVEDGVGTSRLRMQIRKEMLNGFGIAHGGITYSLADSALAFACNSHGKRAVSVETSISHLVQLKEGDEIYAYAKELSRSNKIGLYDVSITNAEGQLVVSFKGTVYRTSKDWDV